MIIFQSTWLKLDQSFILPVIFSYICIDSTLFGSALFTAPGYFMIILNFVKVHSPVLFIHLQCMLTITISGI